MVKEVTYHAYRAVPSTYNVAYSSSIENYITIAIGLNYNITIRLK